MPPVRSQSSPLRQDEQEAVQRLVGGLLPLPPAATGGTYSRSQSSPLQEPGDVPGVASAAQQQSPLPSVLLAVLQAIKSEDAKLSRNGATTLQVQQSLWPGPCVALTLCVYANDTAFLSLRLTVRPAAVVASLHRPPAPTTHASTEDGVQWCALSSA